MLLALDIDLNIITNIFKTYIDALTMLRSFVPLHLLPYFNAFITLLGALIAFKVANFAVDKILTIFQALFFVV